MCVHALCTIPYGLHCNELYKVRLGCMSRLGWVMNLFACRRFWWCRLREGRWRCVRASWTPRSGWRAWGPTRDCRHAGADSGRSCCTAARPTACRRSRTGTAANGRRRSPAGTTLPPNRPSGSAPNSWSAAPVELLPSHFHNQLHHLFITVHLLTLFTDQLINCLTVIFYVNSINIYYYLSMNSLTD